MADILVKCGKCGRESKVSEYATSGAVVCPGCHSPLEFQAADTSRGARLQMRRLNGRDGETLTGTAVEKQQSSEVIAPSQAPVSADVMDGVHKVRQKTRTPLAVWGWLCFAAMAGLLVGAEYLTSQVVPEFLHLYLIGRYVVWGLIALLILMVAFEDGTMQGLLCLFIPPYMLYYAFVRVEYYWLRGFFLGVVVGLAAEFYYIPDQAALALAQKHVNAFVQNVGKQIESVSDSPVGPTQQRVTRQSAPQPPPQEQPKPQKIPRQRAGNY